MKNTLSKISAVTMLVIFFAFCNTGCKKDGNHGQNETCDADFILASSPCANPIPETLQVPAGNRLVLYTYAKGVQIYQVQRSPADRNVFIWVNTAPSATIYARSNYTKQIGIHYVGPSWEFTDGPNKGRKVVAARLQSVTKDATAIPLLLLKTVDSLSVNNKVTYIQRLCTEGGLAPTGGADEQHLGQEVRIPYTASYLFYEGVKKY